MGTKRLIPIVVIILLVAVVAHSQFQTRSLEKFLDDINQKLDYVAVVRVDNFTTLVLKEGNHYLVVEEPDASGMWGCSTGPGRQSGGRYAAGEARTTEPRRFWGLLSL